jgi:hypothetical protein
MARYLRSDATSLSDEDIRDIINAKNLMNRASEVMAKKYKISPRRVYQIWRGEHPPTAPIFDPTSTECSSSFGMPQRGKGAEMIEIKDDDLKAFYERETQRGQKNIEHSLPILSNPALLPK